MKPRENIHLAEQKVEITTIEAARELVRLFDQKIDNMYQILDSGCVNQSVNPNHEMVVVDTLAPYQSFGYSAANVFVNKQQININLNTLKQNALLEAYSHQNWQAEIFTDTLVLETALALFSEGKLKNAEFETILIMTYAKNPHVACVNNVPNQKYKLQSFQLLDKNNEFTEDVKQYLLANLRGFMFQKFNATHIENFRLILQAFLEIYPSENVFFTLRSDELSHDILAGQLGEHLLKAVIYANTETDNSLSITKMNDIKIIPSCIVESALQLACFSLDDVVPVRSMAGDLLKSDVERCVDIGLRPGAVSFPGVPRPEKIHELVVSDSTRRDHDFYHAQTMSRTGKIIREALRRIKDLSRDEILQHCTNPNVKDTAYSNLYSKVTWYLVDSEIEYFNTLRDKENNPVNMFCKALKHKPLTLLRRYTPVLFNQDDSITDLGVITFIDMVANYALWKEAGFDPDLLIDEYKAYFDVAKILYPHFKKGNSIYNIFIFRGYLSFRKGFMAGINLLEEKNINQYFEFRRDNTINYIGLVAKQSETKFNKTIFEIYAANILIAQGINIETKEFFEKIIPHLSDLSWKMGKTAKDRFTECLDNRFLLNLVKKTEDFKRLRDVISAEKWHSFQESIDNNSLIKLVKQMTDLSHLRDVLSYDKWDAFSASLENQHLLDMVEDAYHLVILHGVLSPTYWNNFEKCLTNKFLIKNAEEIHRLSYLREVLTVDTWQNFEKLLTNEFLINLVKASYQLASLRKALPKTTWGNFEKSLNNEFFNGLIKYKDDLMYLRKLLSSSRWQDLLTNNKILFMKAKCNESNIKEFHLLSKRVLQKFIKAQALLLDKEGQQLSTQQSIVVYRSQTDSDIKNDILLWMIWNYIAKLSSKDNEYNPTVFGLVLPVSQELNVSNEDRLVAANDLLMTLANIKSLAEVYIQHQKVLGDGELGEMYKLLKAGVGDKLEKNEEVRLSI